MTATAGRHTIVATFREHDRAREAMRRLEAAGFPADDIGVVAGNIRQAREAAGSFSPQGALVGALLGAALGVVLAILGGTAMGSNFAIAVVAGVVMFGFIGAAIGAITGRAKAFKPRDYERYERAVGMGDTLVTVSVDANDRERAERLLRDAGATGFRDEDSAESP